MKNVRLSLGTAVQIGLLEGEPNPYFTTAFFMTYVKGRCNANCAFCPQAHDSTSASDRLSRISWPVFKLESLLSRVANTSGFRRLCIQSLNYPEAVDDVESIIKQVRRVTSIPLSVCIHPIVTDEMQRLRRAGATSIGIAMDACTPRLFSFVKGADRGSLYRWDDHMHSLQSALMVFGKGNVTTHLIVGLGETESEAARFLVQMREMGISVGLFAFTSIKGTSMQSVKPPDLSSYRRLQVLRYLLATDRIEPDQVHTSEENHLELSTGPSLLKELLSSGDAFRTSGCVECNRPYYNERPRGPVYNYARPLTEKEVTEAIGITGLMT